MPWCVYVLKDPRDGAVRYVGTTRLALKTRLSGHLSGFSERWANPKQKWILELRTVELKPTIEPLETHDTPWNSGVASAREAFWIGQLTGDGADLFNFLNRPDAEDTAAGRFQAYIRKRGLRNYQVAEILGVHESQISSWSRGNNGRPNCVSRALIDLWSDGEVAFDDWGPLPRTGGSPKGIEGRRLGVLAARLGVPIPERLSEDIIYR